MRSDEKCYFLVSLFILCSVDNKECTNTPTKLSHTFRHETIQHHQHLIPTDDSAWQNLMPPDHNDLIEGGGDAFMWTLLYKKIKYYSSKDDDFLKDVSLHDVRLHPNPSSVQWRAQQTNLEYLMMLEVDNLVWSFRKTAGLPTPGTPYGGWEAPNSELRGHFVGHYLSASAQMWASTHNDSLREKMSALVSALAACQDKMGSGYLSAFPSEFFDRFEAIQRVWAPYYTTHKIMAGLLDQYTFARNEQALKMVTWMAEYFNKRVQNVILKYTIERHWTSLNEETGGMNDVLYKLYIVTKDTKHLLLTHLFDKPCFLGLLAMQADELSGFHANTHIPIVIGSQMRYEITRDPLYKAIGTFFMDNVNSSHSYATGGTSVGEFWKEPKRLASTLESENEESCTTYNMLKVSRHLFKWTRKMEYADYYERALTNGVLSIQRGTEPGVMIYMLPLSRGSSKAVSYHGWGTKFDSFWCCYGTGIESFSKLGDSIYFEDQGQIPGLYIIQYVSSSIDWKSGQIILHQKVDPIVSWDPHLRVTLTFLAEEKTSNASTLKLRIPTWSDSRAAKAELNGKTLALQSPDNFLTVTNQWSSTDKLTLDLPICPRKEAIKDDRPGFASLQAILYGPYLLAGLTNGDWDIKTNSTSLSNWITPIPATYNSQLVSLSQEIGGSVYALSTTNQSVGMARFPQSGTDAAVHATFRLIVKDPGSSKFPSVRGLTGTEVSLEPFDLPGMVLVQRGAEKTLDIKVSNHNTASVFRLVEGLDGKHGSVSFKSINLKACYICSDSRYSPAPVIKLGCIKRSLDGKFNQSASFMMKDGVSGYHPISFMAKGSRRNFILMPLYTLRDEMYTVYFNIHG